MAGKPQPEGSAPTGGTDVSTAAKLEEHENKINALRQTTTPQSEGDAPPGGADAGTIAKLAKHDDEIDDLRQALKHLTKSVDLVGDNNKFILTVLYVSYAVIFVGIGVAVITLLITSKK